MPQYYPQEPYYDDYDPNKGYVQMLAVPGRAEQAREFTQITSMSRDFLSRFGDALFSAGAVIRGCVAVVTGQKVTITEGDLYLDGLIRHVDETEVDIQAAGSEVIGVKINRQIITELEDPDLKDPALSYLNYGLPGAHRVKESLEFVVNDPDSADLYTLEDGQLVVDASSVATDVLTDVLARRTYDENGNYKIFGLDLRERNETINNKVAVSLTEGKAYILGYEVPKSYVTSVLHNYAQDTRQVLNEPKVFNNYEVPQTDYKINNYPVKQLDQVKGNVQVTETITRGNVAGGIDYLSNTPVVRVISVKQGATTYYSGTDYQLTNDGIDWSLPGSDPAIGSTYQVVYQYNRDMVVGTDVELKEINGEHYLSMINPAVYPVNGSTIDIDYTFYLCRCDLVLLDRFGQYHVVEGRSDIYRLVQPPMNGDDTMLAIGHTLLLPNSLSVEVTNYESIRLTQFDLFNLKDRVNNMEYNQAITDLDREAIDGEAATDLKGIYTDGFIGPSKMDLSHPDFDCTVNIDKRVLGLPEVVDLIHVLPNTNTVETTIAQIGRVIMCPYQHIAELDQKHTTGTMLVNPYAVYNPMAIVELNPSADNWIDTEKVVIEKTATSTRTITQTGRFTSYSVVTNVETSVQSQIVGEETLEYMRQTDITISGGNFTAGEDNIYCMFNEQRVPLRPISPTVAGTQTGTVKVNADGTINAAITVPPNIPCGSVKVEIIGMLARGESLYQARGTKQIIQDTVLTTRYVSTYVARNVDPLAQTFSFPQDTILTRVGLFFAAKDPSKSVVVQVRGVTNGYPNEVIHSESVLKASDVNLSPTGLTETIVDFEQPVYCKADESYCFTILSDSNLYAMFIAELGKVDLNTGTFVTSNPYTVGVLFSSSNASTWTAHQTMDLKFKLYRAGFTGNGEVIFENVSASAMTGIVLAASSVDYKNQGVEWYYKIGSTGAWNNIEAFTDWDLGGQVTDITVKAVIKSSSYMSPLIANDCVNIVALSIKSSGSYVSRQVEMSEAFTNVKVMINLALPTGTTCSVYTQCEDDPSNGGWVLMSSPTITPISEEYSQYTYTRSSLNAKKYRVKVSLTTNNPTVRPYAQRLMSIMRY